MRLRIGRLIAVRRVVKWAFAKRVVGHPLQIAAHEWLERVRARLERGLALRMAWWRLLGENRPWTGWRAYGDQPPSTLGGRS